MSDSAAAQVATVASAAPTADELEDVLFDARFGDLEALQAFAARFGTSHFASYVDERGNSCLHMAAANGHADVVSYLLDHLPSSAIIRPNAPPASNTPLHWAAMNHHLSVLELLCPRLSPQQVSATNGRGRSAMSEAMEGVGRATRMEPPSAQDDGDDQGVVEDEREKRREASVAYLVEQMKLGDEEEGEDAEGSGQRKDEMQANGDRLVNGVEGLNVSSNDPRPGGGDP